MTTRLMAHLRRRKEAPYKFAKRLGVSRDAVYTLARGYSRRDAAPNATIRPDVAILQAISDDTGISIGALIEDGAAAVVERRDRAAETAANE